VTAACVRSWTTGGVRRSWSLSALAAGVFAACAGVMIIAAKKEQT
jgi:hypothetical protein